MKTSKQSLCKSHVTQLTKVRNQLSYKQTMNYVPLVLCEENNNKLLKAKELISEAINLLNDIK
jgi:hypothetical protein